MSASEDLSKLVFLVLTQDKNIKSFIDKIRAAKNIHILLRYKMIRIPVKVIADFILDWSNDSDEIKDIKNDPEFNEFTLLIFKAITTSPEMREFITLLHQESHLETLMGESVEINTQSLINFIIPNDPTSGRKVVIRREKVPQEPPRKPQYIDGIPLTPNEEVFEEYCAEHFVERFWMKKHRLTWEPKEPKKDKT